MLAAGGTARKKHIAQLAKGLGGKVEAFYFAFGEADAVVIIDLPDNTSAAALALVVSASGAVGTRTTVLITPEEIDEATTKSVPYRPPGA